MHNEINAITKHLFQTENLDQVSETDIENFVSKYPYVAASRFLLAHKRALSEDLVTAGLYINNPLWMELAFEQRGQSW